jgi:hypothetical protein
LRTTRFEARIRQKSLPLRRRHALDWWHAPHTIRPHRLARFQALPRNDEFRASMQRAGKHPHPRCRRGRRHRLSRYGGRLSLGGDRTTAGRTEEILGRWLKGKRASFVLATKCVGQMGPKPWDQGMSRKHILDAIDASLKRLQTDYVDLYQLHGFDPTTPIDEALEALDTVVKSGKSALCRRFELDGASRGARARPQRSEESGAHRFRAAALQSALSQLRARSAAALRRRRRRGHSL